MTKRDKKIMEVVAYTMFYVASKPHVHFMDTYDLVVRWAAQFVDHHQRPLTEYGIGEGHNLEWDEHIELFMGDPKRLNVKNPSRF